MGTGGTCSGVGVVERILEQAREAKRRKAEVYQAIVSLPVDAQREVVAAALNVLPVSAQRELLAELITKIEAAESSAPVIAAANGGAASTSPAAVSSTAKQSFTDKAEAFVLARPAGVKTRDVADGIGQDVSSVDGSLRAAMKRGRITRRGRLWLPLPQKANGASKHEAPGRTTIRDLISRVFASNGNTPLGAAALYEALKRLQTDINRSSVDGEMNRMRKENLLVQVGVGPNGGGLYQLAKEASTRAN